MAVAYNHTANMNDDNASNQNASKQEETREPRMFRFITVSALGAAILALPVGACGDGSTGPGSTRPSRIVAVSPQTATVDAGSPSGSPLQVRVVTEDGEPRENVDVRFLLTSGPGRAAPPTASTGADGTAESAYLPGGRPGEATLRADIPDAPWVSPVSFRRTARPTRRLRLSADGGGDQEAEAGSQLPRPLAVTAAAQEGQPATGARIAFEIVSSPGSAVLSSDTVLTDESASAGVLLTLADDPGEHRIRAVAAAPAAGDTVRFRVRGVEALSSGMRLDSVRPRPVRAGREATLHGRGLGAAEALWLDGSPVSVTSAESGRVRVSLPEEDGCRPRRTATLRLRDGSGGWSDGLEAEVAPAEPALDLAVGEARTLAAPGPGECLRLPASSGRAYRLALVSAARSAGSRTPLAFRVRSGVGGLDGDGSVGSVAASRSLASLRESGALSGSASRADRSALELSLRRGARRELRARGARPVRQADRGLDDDSGLRASASLRSPSTAGDTLRLDFAVSEDMSLSCTDTTDAVTGVVRATGPDVAVVQDTAAPGGFTGEDFGLIRDEFQELVLPTDTSYFGPAADIDGNGRVIVLLTPRVNDLTPRGSDSRVGGFFLPLDLADSGPGGDGIAPEGGATCPASNEGELLYLAAADPEGSFGPPLDRTGALRNARSIGSHELEHLLSAEQRVVLGDGGFGDLQQVWLAEGMAHLAEEAVGHAALNMETGSNLDFDSFQDSRERLEAFNVFHLQNFGRLQLFLRSPTLTPALAAVDPGGNPGLRMRGYAWLFSRWLGDHFSGGDEAALFRRLSGGGTAHLQGIENVERVTGTAWQELLLEFVRVPLLDDREASTGARLSPSPRSQLATWNLPGVYEGLQDNPSAGRLFPVGYPLAPVRLGEALDLLTLDLPAAAPAYFAVGGSAPSPALALRLSTVAGAAPPSSARLHFTVIRTR